MEQTSRLSIVIDTNNAEANIERLRASLQRLGQDGLMVSQRLSDIARLNPLSGLNGQVARSTQNFNQFNQTVHHTQNTFVAFNRTVHQTTNNITRMGDTINRNTTIINNYTNSVNRTSSSLSTLHGILSGSLLGSLTRLHGLLTGGIFAMAGLSVLKTADAMQSLDSQIKLVTKSEAEYLTIRQKVREIADKNYADIEATTNLYQNSARALANLGKTQQEALVFTNAVSLAMRTGGKSALEQKSALYQLGQAMQSGVLNGDEFRSISENAPILLDLISQKLKITRGEVREMSKEGKITAELIYDTLANATPKLEEMAKKMPVTMGQAFALVRNKYKEFIGDFMNNDTGLSGVIAKSLAVSSLHFNTFAKVAVAGAGVAMLSFTNRVLASGTALTKLATIMKAHPIFAVASVVMAVSVANRGLDATLKDLGDTLSVFGMMIKDTMSLFGELGGTAYQVLKDILSNTQDTTQTSSQLFGGFFSDVGGGFEGLTKGTAKTFDAMAIMVKTFGQKSGELLGYVVSNTGNMFKLMANNIADVFERVVNSVINNSVNFIISRVNDVIDFTNNVSGLLGADPIQKLTPFESKFSVGRFQVGNMVATRSWQEIFDENAKSQIQNGALSYVNGLYSATNAPIPNTNLNNPMGEYQKPKDKDKKGDKDKKKKDDKKYTYTQSELQQLQHVQKLIYGTNLSDGKTLAWHAEQAGLPPERLAGLMMQESKGIAHNKSHTGAYGYFQFTGNYRKDWGVSYKQGADLEIAGKTVIKSLTHAFKKLGNWDDAILSHNAGIDGARLLRNKSMVQGTPERQKEVKEFVPKNAKWTAYFAGKNLSDKTKTLSQEGREFYQNQSEQDEKIKQSQQEIQSWFADIKQQRKDQYDEKVKKVIAIYGNNSKQSQSIIKYLQDDLLRQIELDKLTHDLQTQPLAPHEKINIEWRIADLEALLNHTLTDKQKEVQQQANERNATRKITELEIALAENYLSLGNYNGSLEKLGTEKFIEKKRISLNEYLTDDEKIEYVIKLDDKYKYLEEQFIQSQKAKIAELNQLNTGIQQDGRYAKYMDDFYKKTMSKPSYERWKLNNEFAKGEAEENARYQEFQDKVNAKDDTGNYVIEDALERQRLLKEAEQNHLNEMHAMREEYAEKSRQIHMDNMSQTLQGYASTFGEMSNIIKAFGGEQSKSYRAMFAISKAFAVADIGIKMGQAMGQAWGDPSATTIWQKMANVTKVTLAQGHLMQIINAISPKGFATGGYTGNIGTNQIAGVVHGQEYVLNAQATKRIGVDTLNRLNNGDGIGGGVNVVINNYTSETATAQQMPNGDIMVIIGQVAEQIAQNKVEQYHRNQFRQGGAYYGK